MAATYKFYYIVSGNGNVQKKEYVSSYNINQVTPHFLKENQNVSKIERIDDTGHQEWSIINYTTKKDNPCFLASKL